MKRISILAVLPAAALILAVGAFGCRGGAAPEAAPTAKAKPVRPQVYTAAELTASTFPVPEGYRSIVLVGDIMTWDRMQKFLEKDGVEYPFRGTAGLLQSADLTVGNLEGPIAVNATMKKQRYPYKVPPWTLKGLAWAGFDQVSLANNHLADCKQEGMTETMQYVSEAGIGYFGAGKNRDEAAQPRIVDVGGTKVALCGFVTGETYLHDLKSAQEPKAYERRDKKIRQHMGASATQPGTIVASAKSVAEMIRKAREQADIVIFFPHWGIRYHRPVSDYQQELARAAVDAGADLVVGHHAHFWQPVGSYKGVPIVYGIGNFAFGSANSMADAGLLVRALVKDKRVQIVELFPTYSKNADKRVRFQTKIKKGEFANAALAEMAEQSRPLGATIAVENGRGVIRLD
jgi:poly-gamma-glutamate capsule biosynthesis protein CapA/YwtB (metallophosphatase superfamily)